MTVKPMKFHFKDEYEPHVVHTPIPIPYHWEEQVKKDIDRDVSLRKSSRGNPSELVHTNGGPAKEER